MNETTTQNTKATTNFSIEKVYIKDVSYEVPNVPEIFKDEWKPNITLNLDVKSKVISPDLYEVYLKLTITNKINEKIAFLIEVTQAGLFTIKGFQEDQLKAIMGTMCPQILLPYAREAISDLTGKGGFPPLYLAPINFEGLYQQKMNEEKNKETK